MQNKKYFTSAPKDIQEVIEDKPERFKGAHFLGYFLMIVSALCIVGAFLFGAVDGIKNGFTFWQFFARFLIMLYLYKAFDMTFIDYYLLTKSHFSSITIRKRKAVRVFIATALIRNLKLQKLLFFPLLLLQRRESLCCFRRKKEIRNYGRVCQIRICKNGVR